MRRRILLLTLWNKDWIKGVEGGNPNVYYLLEYLSKKGWEFLIIFPKEKGDKVEEIGSYHHYPLKILKLTKLLPKKISFLLYPLEVVVNNLLFSVRAMRVIGKKKVHLILTFAGSLSPSVWILSKVKKTKNAVKLFGVYLFSRYYKFPFFLFFSLDPYLAYKIPIDLLLVVDDGTKGDLMRNIFSIREEKFRFITQPAPKNWRIITNAKELLGIDKKRKVILFVGALNKIKGAHFLVPILKRVKKKINDVLLLVVGEGPLLEILKEEARRELLSDSVAFFGKVPHRKLETFYSAADVFISLSVYSNLTLPVVESLTMGVPVVTYDLMDTRKVIFDGTNGFLIGFGKIDEFAEKVVLLLQDDELRRKMSHEARKFADSYFPSWEEVMEKVYSILDGHMRNEGT